MKIRFLSISAIAVLMFNIVSFAAVDKRKNSVKSPKSLVTARLVSSLPASDGVVVFESKRFLSQGLPKVLSANQPMLTEILAALGQIETRTGIDLKKFDQIAVGVTMKQLSPTNPDIDAVAIATGDINPGALIALAKLASKGAYREEKIGDRKIFIFTPKDIVQKSTVTVKNSKVQHVIDQAVNSAVKEIAITALDGNTLAFGSLKNVQDTLSGTSHIDPEVLALLPVKETAVLRFAVKPPSGASALLPAEFDSVDKSIDSIQFMSGSLDIAALGTSLQMLAKTKTPEQALEMKDMLDVMQSLGAGFLGGSKRADQKVYGRMIKNAKFSVTGTDVSFDLMVPQADIDVLVTGVR